MQSRFNRVAHRCATKLGTQVTIDGVPVMGIVEDVPQFVNNTVTATITTISVPRSDIDKPKRGDAVTYNGVIGEVFKVEPDGPDWAIILKA